MRVARRVLRQHTLEIVEELRQAKLQERLRPPQRFGLLLLVVELLGQRVVDVVPLDQEVGHRHLQLVGPVLSRFARRREGVPLAQEQQDVGGLRDDRSEEHTSELQSLMRISYAVFCLKKKKTTK